MKFKRKDLKRNAKAALKNYYWLAFLACLIVFLIAGAVGSGPAVTTTQQVMQQQSSGALPTTEDVAIPDEMTDVDSAPDFTTAVTDALAGSSEGVSVAVGKSAPYAGLLAILVANIMEIGNGWFFVNGRRNGKAELGDLFQGFKEKYGRNVITLFLRGIYTFLWSLLLVIPGIVKSYEYSMIPYILADNPEMSRHEAFVESKRLTKGNKWRLFKLDLSFIGWIILAIIPFGLGLFFLAPYMEATKAEAYQFLKETKANEN